PGNLTSVFGGGPIYFEAPGYFATQQGYNMTAQGATVNASLLAGGIISGTVTDSITQQPLAGISVQLQVTCNGLSGCLVNNPNGGANPTAITDANGHYQL